MRHQPILRVADIQRSLAYYVDVLGFTKAPWGDGFTSVSRDRCGIYLCEGSQGSAGTWVWAGVNDVERLYASIEAYFERLVPMTSFQFMTVSEAAELLLPLPVESPQHSRGSSRSLVR